METATKMTRKDYVSAELATLDRLVKELGLPGITAKDKLSMARDFERHAAKIGLPE